MSSAFTVALILQSTVIIITLCQLIIACMGQTICRGTFPTTGCSSFHQSSHIYDWTDFSWKAGNKHHHLYGDVIYNHHMISKHGYTYTSCMCTHTHTRKGLLSTSICLIHFTWLCLAWNYSRKHLLRVQCNGTRLQTTWLERKLNHIAMPIALINNLVCIDPFYLLSWSWQPDNCLLYMFLYSKKELVKKKEEKSVFSIFAIFLVGKKEIIMAAK